MKKSIKNLFMVTLLLTLIFTLASCGGQGPKPNLDLDEVKDNLEDKDYYVSLVDDEDDLDVGVEQELYADGDGDDYVYIIEFKDAKMAKLAFKGLKLENESEIESLKLSIKNIENKLEKYEDDLNSFQIDTYENQLKELNKELERRQDEKCYGISGKFIWQGTEDAIKDTK